MFKKKLPIKLKIKRPHQALVLKNQNQHKKKRSNQKKLAKSNHKLYKYIESTYDNKNTRTS